MTTPISVPIKFLPLLPGVKLPKKMSKHAAAYDIFAPEDFTLTGNELGYKVQLGFAFEIPKDFCVTICDRSSMRNRKKISAFPGLIDSDYRGEILLFLDNLENVEKKIKKDHRIAQLKLEPVYNIAFEKSDQLSSTERADGAIGSTGC